MYSLKNVNTEVSVVFTNTTGKTVEFVIETIVNRRLRDAILPKSVFVILNGYLEYKGKEYIDGLYDRLVECKNLIILNISRDDVDVLPNKVIHNVLDYMDLQDVIEYIKTSKYVKIPPKFPEEYDTTRDLDEKGSREQTYTRNDYIELIALITILKATTGPLGNFATIKEEVIGGTDYKEMILFNFYRTHPLFKSDPFVKIFQSLIKLVERLLKNSEGTAIKIIERNLTTDIFPFYVTGKVVIQKLLLNNETEDSELRNTVTKIYTFASDQLNLKENGSKTKIKYFKNEDTDTGDAESVFESGRSNSDVNSGFIEEFKNVSRNVPKLVHDLGITTKLQEVNEIIKVFKSLETTLDLLPVEENIYIASIIHKHIMDPRAFVYLEGETFIHLALSFIWLYENGYENLALMLTTTSISTDVFKLNFSLRNKLDSEIRDGLIEAFPYQKDSVINGQEKEVNYIDDSITILSKKLMGYNLFSIFSEDLLERYFDTRNREVAIREDIKNELAHMILTVDSKH